eukprot:9502938-Pyramimonas_sp.AAC.1
MAESPVAARAPWEARGGPEAEAFSIFDPPPCSSPAAGRQAHRWHLAKVATARGLPTSKGSL